METAPGQRYALPGYAASGFVVYNNFNCLKKHMIYPAFGYAHLPDSEDMVYIFLSRRD